ncbi:MAG: tRNA 2-thiouridine(34) synthase MnmA [Propionibacteriaceae bacterium]|nr:tRNA 2-thiouridine(34) synthase MnmA [Propionibacteriaceae bacterium]
MKILCAISGGVDSAVAAARLVAAGHTVTGVHLRLWENPSQAGLLANQPRFDHASDAQHVAEVLGIPLLLWDFTKEFKTEVIDYFVAAYAKGETPNPCLRCNQKIKFSAMLTRARGLGFEALATGHYALIENAAGQRSLHRSSEAAKDQSYVLGVLNQDQLAHSLFPLGSSPAKADIRAEAAKCGFNIAEKPDSSDICFIPDGDTAAFLRKQLGRREGNIVASDGTVLGTHLGSYQFTVGQRHGLRLRVPAADGRPRYVKAIDAQANTVVVGSKQDLSVGRLRGTSLTFTQAVISEPWSGFAQWRAHGAAVPANFSYCDDELRVEFVQPVVGIALGQTVVCYEQGRVVGSAQISKTATTKAPAIPS